MSYQTRSIKDKPILNVDLLKKMALKKGITVNSVYLYNDNDKGNFS